MELFRECEMCIHRAVCKFRNDKFDYIPETKRFDCELFNQPVVEQERIIDDWNTRRKS